MLDRDIVQEFFESEIACSGLETPPDIEMSCLADTFADYVENDYYEWLKDNFKSFFNHNDPDWDWIRTQISSRQRT